MGIYDSGNIFGIRIYNKINTIFLIYCLKKHILQ
jgi:hypothetical protein